LSSFVADVTINTQAYIDSRVGECKTVNVVQLSVCLIVIGLILNVLHLRPPAVKWTALRGHGGQDEIILTGDRDTVLNIAVGENRTRDPSNAKMLPCL